MSPASALVSTKPVQHLRWQFCASRWQRRREVVEVVGRGLDISSGTESFDRAAHGDGTEQSDRAPPVGDLDGLSLLYQTE
jgi:hypothetical protein